MPLMLPPGSAGTSRPGERRRQLQRQLSQPLPQDPELVLVTDLDGTLLGGALPWRRCLYQWLARERHRVVHVFSTGRDLDSVARVLRDQAPHGLQPPHLVIGDVGASVACGVSLALVPQVVEGIEQRWQGKAERVLPLLRGLAGVAPQPVTAHRRLAYLIDAPRLDRQALRALEAHGVDCLVSDDRYLDVMPAGVNKGTTLLALLDWLEVEHHRVVTAGDTLNDLAMFETGLQGVVVANAEPALLAELPRLPATYRARSSGCQGIVEALHHFGFAARLPLPAALG